MTALAIRALAVCIIGASARIDESGPSLDGTRAQGRLYDRPICDNAGASSRSRICSPFPGRFVNNSKKPPQNRPVDKPASNDWQPGAARVKGAAARQRGAAKAAASPAVRRAPAWEVTAADLECLDAVRSLLSALNNAYVSTNQIQTLILDIPVLAARCVRRLGVTQTVSPEVLARALTSIGNMGLESELLGLLEDLTTCRADLKEAEAAGPPSEPPG
jgi:hypothetical protein